MILGLEMGHVHLFNNFQNAKSLLTAREGALEYVEEILPPSWHCKIKEGVCSRTGLIMILF